MADTSANVQKIVESVEKLSLLEVSELGKALEDKFGVSAAVPMMMGAMPGAAGAAVAAAEEKTEFTVMVTVAGANKIGVIKAVREIKPELGLAEAKAFAESLPKMILENVKKEAADEAKKKLEAAGATVELK